jgi:8-oxo-dGTP pyrophosphatase MutT (NUDIX family)
MPTGKTMKGTDASGAMVVVYYMDRLGPTFLMGQETTYLTEVHKKISFKSNAGENIWKAFLHPGSIENEDDVIKAKSKFTGLCKELEKFNPRFIKHVTFADVKNSKAEPGNISAKPRCVPEHNSDKFGFPKGGFELNEDASINDTVVRECEQETGIKLDITKLQEIQLLERQGYYALFLYELSEVEFTAVHDAKILHKKNEEYENELHNVRFMRIPNMNLRRFFINALSRDAYEHIIKFILPKKGGSKKSRRHTRKVESSHISRVHVSSLRDSDNWYDKVFVNRKTLRKVNQ